MAARPACEQIGKINQQGRAAFTFNTTQHDLFIGSHCSCTRYYLGNRPIPTTPTHQSPSPQDDP
jgi:hypothetical protein